MNLPRERYPATDHDPNASLIRMVKAVPDDTQDQPFYSRWIYLPKACTVVAELTGPDGAPQDVQSYPLGPDASWHPLRVRRLMTATTGDVYIAD
ncbi:hypothetical protein [Paraburkholderia acidisoli]|uniref:Uncharacterized protein n=1 Tax=Paraburkholderia acidisoli TaxID=2571748 RepID=A0A7Z2GMN9_9BURK|nr:hypothetical protein [Paraburkholderia acidisoli]QGZ64360.1 hypothetical protein FAZ98_21815 [Paraburkholderia acidisoli]